MELRVKTLTGSILGRRSNQSAEDQFYSCTNILQIDPGIKSKNHPDQKNLLSAGRNFNRPNDSRCSDRSRSEISGVCRTGYFQRRRTMAGTHGPLRVPRNNLRTAT
jgi:hypothetical protein